MPRNMALIMLIHSIMKSKVTTLSIRAVSIMTPNITELSMMTLSIMTVYKKTLTQHNYT